MSKKMTVVVEPQIGIFEQVEELCGGHPHEYVLHCGILGIHQTTPENLLQKFDMGPKVVAPTLTECVIFVLTGGEHDSEIRRMFEGFEPAEGYWSRLVELERSSIKVIVRGSKGGEITLT